MSSYINLPIDTDPEDILNDAYAYLQSIIPGWNPANGNLDAWLLQAISSAAAESRDVASAIPKAIFRFFGANLVGIPPINAAAATAQTTWTMKDTAGYTIPDGTHVQIAIDGQTFATFQTVGAVVVLPGNSVTTAGQVNIVAVTPGVASSGLGTIGGTVSLLDPLAFVTGITQVAPTSGGADAESDDDYLGRLVEGLKLLAPRPIVPADFEFFAEQITGVADATAIDGYQPAVNEVQSVSVAATGGTFTLTLGANTTGALAWNIAASALQTALQGLASIGAGNVTVTGGPGATAPLVCTFVSGKAATDMAAMTANSASLTGGAHTATPSTITNGAAASTGNEKMITIVSVDSSGNPVSGPVKSAVQADAQSRREVNFIVNVADQVTNTIVATINVHLAAGVVLGDVSADVQAAATAYINSVPLAGTVYVNGIIDAVWGIDGVLNVQVTTPSGDVNNTALQKPVAGAITVGTF